MMAKLEHGPGEDSELLAAPCEDEPAVPPDDELSAADAERSRAFGPPERGYKSCIYYRDLPEDPDGFARVAIVNRKLATPLGVVVSYGKKELPLVVEWKNLDSVEYVVGIEPANCRVAGRAEERRRGTLRFIEPGERRDLEVRIRVLDSLAAIEELASSVQGG